MPETRREFVKAAAAAVMAAPPPAPLIVPVVLVTDSRAKCTPQQLQHFSADIWPEAVRDFSRCGIQFQVRRAAGEVRRSPGGRPLFTGLDRSAINLVVTDSIPLRWDTGRGLAGVTTRDEGYHICMVALNHAHGHQVPFVSVNTCVHELLHALMQDIFESRPDGLPGTEREFRIDWYATCLWLFHSGAAIRESARVYLERLRTVPTQ